MQAKRELNGASDYAALSLAEVKAGMEAVAREVQADFGVLAPTQLNWRPDAASWSVAQCLEHLVSANHQMLRCAEDALRGAVPRGVWHRLPLWPRIMGRLLVTSQAPQTTRKFKAPSQAQPAASDIAPDIVQRFVDQHDALAARLASLDAATAARTIMVSPFVGMITYSVLDGWRLMYAHDCRHVQQAHRVVQAEGFPSA